VKTLLLAVLVMLPRATGGAEGAATCDGSEPAASAARFVACAREATARYRDQAAAILDGYRPIGRDFPAMGEHWIRITLVFDGRFDPGRPEVLTYATVRGRPRLTGVAYALPLQPGETPPAGPGGAESWHDHFSTIEDETVMDHQHGPHPAGDTPRIAMMHAWIWTDNPEGMFAADNWAIPFMKLGLARPEAAPPAAGRALSLLTGGQDYFERVIAAAAPARKDDRTASAALAEARAAVERIAREAGGESLSDQDAAALEGVWRAMWDRIDRNLPEDARARLAHLAIR
jgi:hypothetical protein